MMYTQVYSFIDQLGFDSMSFVFTIAMSSVLIGLLSKSMLND